MIIRQICSPSHWQYRCIRSSRRQQGYAGFEELSGLYSFHSGIVHFIWIPFTFTVRAGRPSKDYGSTLSPAKQSLPGVLMRLLVISLFHYFIISFTVSIHMYLPADRRKRGKCCMYAHVRASAGARSCWCTQVLVHASGGARKWWCTQVVVHAGAGNPSSI